MQLITTFPTNQFQKESLLDYALVLKTFIILCLVLRDPDEILSESSGNSSVEDLCEIDPQQKDREKTTINVKVKKAN